MTSQTAIIIYGTFVRYILPFMPLIIALIVLTFFLTRGSLKVDILEFSILGIIFMVMGLMELILSVYLILPYYLWYQITNLFAYYSSLIVGSILLILGFSFIVFEGLNRAGIISKVQEKGGYLDVKWLKHQYHDLGLSIQEIANDQNVTMMKIR
ncbi:MAG: hypothetical protein ACFFBI_15665, partial [Promethearchaeota archaeon]